MTGGEPDPALAAVRALHAELAELAAVGEAEGIVRSARFADLVAAQDSAWRRVSATRGWLTRAQRDGSAARIGTAAVRLRERQDVAGQLAEGSIEEMRQILRAEIVAADALLSVAARARDLTRER